MPLRREYRYGHPGSHVTDRDDDAADDGDDDDDVNCKNLSHHGLCLVAHKVQLKEYWLKPLRIFFSLSHISRAGQSKVGAGSQ